jgi:hypothetical protein
MTPTIPDEAVQADYEDRIRSAIELSGNPGQQEPSAMPSDAGFEPYMQIVEFFDKDETAASFLKEDGEGGFLSGIYRMAREIETLRNNLSPRAQALEEAALLNEAKELAFMAISRMRAAHVSCLDLTMQAEKLIGNIEAAIRALSSPVADRLPPDVINLVIAAREAFDTGVIPDEEEHNLDKALEPFSERVPYENEPGCPACGGTGRMGPYFPGGLSTRCANCSQHLADGWLPIETAPKDGTDFIGWDGKWAFRCSAGKKYVLYPHQDGGPTYQDVWDGHYYDSLTIEHPTHWRPLPPAPGASE